MRAFLFIVVILALGAAVLAVPISYIGLDPLPGDFTLNLGNLHQAIPVTYSLCASFGLGLLYYLLKR